jgi:oxygen-independent coproporphyrinogen-3 oxidase
VKQNATLLEKYDKPAPRYTSYPTVPHWSGKLTAEKWQQHVQEAVARQSNSSLSLYVHLPFCEALCTFCGCHKIITRNHDVEEPYIEALVKEWSLYQKLFSEKKNLPVKEIHFGGGTPTFFSPESLNRLLEALLRNQNLERDVCEFSVEVHPKTVTKEHLETLARWGCSRLSIGVQDFDPQVQQAIGRKQSEEDVAQVCEWARALNMNSINFDLIFGLPFQTHASLQRTLERVIALKPDRIAFYSYAHVPWLKPGQSGFSPEALPVGANKMALYELGREAFLAAGYVEIGFDHFALPHDSLARSLHNDTLHRNFMGYTTQSSSLLLGLGISSIGDAGTAFGQNEKTLQAYYRALAINQLPIAHGHILSSEDEILRNHIANLMCHLQTQWKKDSPDEKALLPAFNDLKQLEEDHLVVIGEGILKVTDIGRRFLRNICMAIDARQRERTFQKPTFSQSV